MKQWNWTSEETKVLCKAANLQMEEERYVALSEKVGEWLADAHVLYEKMSGEEYIHLSPITIYR